MHMSFRTESPNTSATQIPSVPAKLKERSLVFTQSISKSIYIIFWLATISMNSICGVVSPRGSLGFVSCLNDGKTMEKAAVLDSDELCGIQMSSVGFRRCGQHLNGFGEPGVCSSSCLLAWMECVEREEATGLRTVMGLGKSSSLSGDAFSRSRETRGANP